VDNIKIDLREIELGTMDWIDLAQEGDQWRALLTMLMNFRVPEYFWKFLSNHTTGVF
jgi:hypothetical protein